MYCIRQRCSRQTGVKRLDYLRLHEVVIILSMNLMTKTLKIGYILARNNIPFEILHNPCTELENRDWQENCIFSACWGSIQCLRNPAQIHLHYTTYLAKIRNTVHTLYEILCGLLFHMNTSAITESSHGPQSKADIRRTFEKRDQFRTTAVVSERSLDAFCRMPVSRR